MIPDAAIEAAAEAIYRAVNLRRGEPSQESGANSKRWDESFIDARAALEAAMPAIREAIAQEIEKAALRPAAYQRAFADAALIVRGGAK